VTISSPLSALVTWLLAAELAWVPAPTVDLPRYEAIARDIASVAFDPDERPLFAGTTESSRRARTALLLDAVASFESFYREDVDNGTKRGALGEVCVLQVLTPSPRTRIVLTADTYRYSEDASEGWSREDMVADRKKCVRAALHKMRESFRACHNLSLYTAGICNADEKAAKNRAWRAEAWWKHHPFLSELNDVD
jgi:hypothetical protein